MGTAVAKTSMAFKTAFFRGILCSVCMVGPAPQPQHEPQSQPYSTPTVTLTLTPHQAVYMAHLTLTPHQAVYMASFAKDLPGKMVAIWFPISANPHSHPNPTLTLTLTLTPSATPTPPYPNPNPNPDQVPHLRLHRRLEHSVANMFIIPLGSTPPARAARAARTARTARAAAAPHAPAHPAPTPI